MHPPTCRTAILRAATRDSAPAADRGGSGPAGRLLHALDLVEQPIPVRRLLCICRPPLRADLLDGSVYALCITR
jgi:hypothetical protein